MRFETSNYIVFRVKNTWELHQKDTGKDAELSIDQGGSRVAEHKYQTPLIVLARHLETAAIAKATDDTETARAAYFDAGQ